MNQVKQLSQEDVDIM
jgi:prevent-host-death family protein